MEQIYSRKGDMYAFDPSTLRIFKNGVLMSSEKVEPVYISSNVGGAPMFTGLFLKDKGSILTLNGEENQAITNINLVE